VSFIESCLADEARKLRATFGERYIIDICSIVRSFGIRLLLDRMDYHVNGLYLPRDAKEPHRIHARMSRDRLPQETRYTIAHELGHFFQVEKCGFPTRCYMDSDAGSNAPEERSANYFADIILMPEEIIAPRILDLKLRPRSAIEMISTLFWVSNYRARARLLRLGLIPDDDENDQGCKCAE
jgi:hypothetical protein